MTHYPAALAFALVLTVSSLAGCDRSADMTEQEHIQRAKDFEDKGDLKGGIIELKNAVQKNPESPQARLLLGQIYLKTGMGEEAEKEFSQAKRLGVGHESIQVYLGEALLLMGEHQRVLDEIQPGENTSKTNLAHIFQLRANALLGQGKLKEACDLFQKSLYTETSIPPTYWGLAQCAVAERDMAKAKKWLDTALKITSRQAKTWIFIGDWEQLNKNPQGALAAYTNALKLEPNNREALQNRAIRKLSLGQVESARGDVEKVVKLAPKSLSAYYLQALLGFEEKKYPQTSEALQEVFKITPDHSPSILLAGATAYSLGAYQQAESHLNRFLTRFPGHAYARRVMAATKIKLQLPQKALEILSPLLSADANDAAALALAGEAYLLKGDPTKASQYLQRAAAIDPTSASIQTQLGLSHLLAGNDQLAIVELVRASSLDANQQKADFLLVMAHLNHGEYDKALSAIDALEQKLPNNAATHTIRGKALLGKNDLSNARKNFDQALTIDSTYFPAVASLAQLDIRDKNPAAARKRFERILDKDKNNYQAMMALVEWAAMNKQEKDYINWLEKASKAHPKIITPRAMLVRHYLTKNESQKALVIAKEVLNDNADNPVALDLLGSVQLAINDKMSATNTYSKMAQKAAQSPDVLLRLALAQITENRLLDARTTLQKALKLKPNHQQSLDVLIKLEMKDKKPEKALQLARQVQKLVPESPLGFEREGDIHLYQKHPVLAAKVFELALNKDASSAGLIKLHRAYILTGNIGAAEQYLANWIKQYPNDLTVRAYAAESYASQERNKEAIAQYQAILQLKPGNALILNNLANLYQKVSDPRAQSTAERALKFAPEDPAVQDTLGWILIQQGQTQRGLELLRKAVSKISKSETVRYHYAIALARAGDKTNARKEFEFLLKEAPHSPEARAVKVELRKL